MQRVLGWSIFMFWCHRHDQRKQERERGKKKTIKKVPNSSNIASILKMEYVCMGMHEHVTCKRNCIMGSVQS